MTPRMRRARTTSTRKVWLHRGLATLWALLAIPGILWWKDSILFVILVSLYANFASELAAAEAADDRELSDRLTRVEQQLTKLNPRGGEDVCHPASPTTNAPPSSPTSAPA